MHPFCFLHIHPFVTLFYERYRFLRTLVARILEKLNPLWHLWLSKKLNSNFFGYDHCWRVCFARRNEDFVGKVDVIQFIFSKLDQSNVDSNKSFAAFSYLANAFFAQGDIEDIVSSSLVFSVVRNIVLEPFVAVP